MPRINTSGVTDKRTEGYYEPGETEFSPDVIDPDEGGESSSHGKNSSTSGDSKKSDTVKNGTQSRKPARTTELR